METELDDEDPDRCPVCSVSPGSGKPCKHLVTCRCDDSDGFECLAPLYFGNGHMGYEFDDDATGQTTPSSRTVAPTVAKPSPPQNPVRDPDLLVVAGRLAEAADELDRLRELNSSQVWKPWYVSAPLFIENGDVDGYKTLCSEMLIRFADSTKPGDVSKVAKACLLLPPAD